MNEDQYYNPIIQAMIHTAQLQKQGQQQEIEKERNKQLNEQAKAEQATRKQLADQAQKQIDYSHEHNVGQLEVQRMLAEAELRSRSLQNKLAAQQFVHGGGDYRAVLDSIAPSVSHALSGGAGTSTPLPTPAQSAPTAMQGITGQPKQDETPPPNPFGSAHDANAIAAEAAGMKAKAESEAKLPNEIQLKNLDNEHKLSQLGVQKGYDESIARIHGDYANANTRINGAFHLEGIRLMHQLGLDDGSGGNASIAKSLLDGIFNGNGDYSKLTPDQKRAVTGYAQGTGELSSIPSDGKAYKAKLDSVSGIQTLISQYKDLAANYSRDSQGANERGNQNITLPIVGTLQRTRPGSDLESKIAAMKSSGGQLATFFDQQNRKSDAEIIRQVMGEFDPKATAKQNVDKLTTHVKQLNNAVKQAFVGMNPDRIKSVLSERGIDDPNLLAGGVESSYEDVRVNPKTGHEVGKKNGKWYDVKTGAEYNGQ